jgi:hypothetical protein
LNQSNGSTTGKTFVFKKKADGCYLVFEHWQKTNCFQIKKG